MSFDEHGGRKHIFQMIMKSLGPTGPDLVGTKAFRAKDWCCGLTTGEKGLYMYVNCYQAPFANITIDFCARFDAQETWDYKSEVLHSETVEMDGETDLSCQYFDDGKIKNWLNEKNVLFYVWIRINYAVILRAQGEDVRAMKPDIMHESEWMRRLFMEPDNQFQRIVVVQNYMDPQDIEVLVQYLSFKKVIDVDSAPRLIRIASMLECPMVIRACEAFFLENTDKYTYQQKERFADQFKLHELRNHVYAEAREIHRRKEKEREEKRAKEKLKEIAKERAKERARERAKERRREKAEERKLQQQPTRRRGARK